MLVELKKICKDYPQGKEMMRVLKDVDLTVEMWDGRLSAVK